MSCTEACRGGGHCNTPTNHIVGKTTSKRSSCPESDDKHAWTMIDAHDDGHSHKVCVCPCGAWRPVTLDPSHETTATYVDPRRQYHALSYAEHEQYNYLEEAKRP